MYARPDPCHSDGSVYFTTLGCACEYPNGLTFSPDARTLSVANICTRMCIHAFHIQPNGSLTHHPSLARISSPEEGVPEQFLTVETLPDGIQLDELTLVFFREDSRSGAAGHHRLQRFAQHHTARGGPHVQGEVWRERLSQRPRLMHGNASEGRRGRVRRCGDAPRLLYPEGRHVH
jgi:hypothetical protein